MNCKQCGAPAVEGATYCGYCGARVDGKKSCHACGKLNDERFAFCIYCGTRIDGKTACKNCGTAHDGAFFSFIEAVRSAAAPQSGQNAPSCAVPQFLQAVLPSIRVPQ